MFRAGLQENEMKKTGFIVWGTLALGVFCFSCGKKVERQKAEIEFSFMNT